PEGGSGGPPSTAEGARSTGRAATAHDPPGSAAGPAAAPADSASNGSGGSSSGSASGAGGISGGGGQVVQDWLNAAVPLPAGYRTTRRDVLKLGSLGGALACLYVAATRAKAMSFASPQALMNALMPPPVRAGGDGLGRFEPGAPSGLGSGADSGDRVEAFKRYIGDLERRGGGREVPDFPRGGDWLNSSPLILSGPPSARGSLAGRLVVLDFWTYCCINCIHVLPDLAQLEAQFAGAPVAVVGVHSAKFDNEKDSSAIRSAVLRYDISHPVVNDRGMAVWGALGVSSWPTLAVVSPRGRLLAMLSGEGHRQDLEDLLTAALQYYEEAGQLDGSTPLPMALERNKQQVGRFGDVDGFGPEALLQHPLAVLSSADGSTVFVADSYNHRIKALNPGTNELVTVAGSGSAGFRDGAGAEAQFSEPAGLALGPGGSVFVADTNNGAIRVLDPATRRVTTLALRGVPEPRVDPVAAAAAAAATGGAGGGLAAPPQGFQLVRAAEPLAVGAAGGELTVTVRLPRGYHLTAGAGSSYFTQLLPAGGGGTTVDVTAVAVRPASGRLPDEANPSVRLTVVPTAAAAAADGGGRLVLRLLAKVYYCQEDDVCLFEQVCFEVPLVVGGGGGAVGAVALRYDVVPAATTGFVLQ
ncbi:NHL repeat-containing protein 2, partial [Tetrabaena socialis]